MALLRSIDVLHVISYEGDGHIHVWNADNGQQLVTLARVMRLHAVAPNMKVAVAGDTDDKLVLYYVIYTINCRLYM